MSTAPLANLKEIVRPYYLKWLYFRLAAGNCPAGFNRWLEYTSTPIDSSLRETVIASDDRCDAIFLPMADWHGILQRSQQLARALAALGHRCFYLNPHLGREFPQPFPFSQRRLVTTIAPRVLEAHVHLFREPVFHHRCLRADEVDELSDALLALLDHAGSAQQFTLVSFPLWADVGRRIRTATGAPLVYDCHDLLEGFHGISPELIEAEQELMQTADLVLFTADWLAQEHIGRLPALASKSLVLRNAADPSDFEDVYRRKSRKGQQPVIGYIGSLNSWFDVEAVSLAARKHPEWRFVLVGPMAHQFARPGFNGLENVELVGEVPHDDVPKWMAQFDVGLIPFLIQPLTIATNPVKLYEYFACGLPVVSSRLGEVERYADLVYLSRNPEEFVRAIELAVAEDDPARMAARRRVAEQESWRARAQTLVKATVPLLSSLLSR